MPMSEAQSAMADRVRALLADEQTLTEKAMFGSRAFLLNDRIAVAVFKEADVLIRVDVDDEAQLLLERGASRAAMGPRKRDMGPGWMLIDHETLPDDDRLLFWVDAARDRNRAEAEQE